MAPRGALTWTRPLVPECYDGVPTAKIVFHLGDCPNRSRRLSTPTPSKAAETKVGITIPTLAVRGRERLRPWAARPPKHGARGRIADGGGRNRVSERIRAGQWHTTQAGGRRSVKLSTQPTFGCCPAPA